MHKIPEGEPSLDNLRHEIDAIDDQIHDLLMRRAEIAVTIGKTKTHAKDAKTYFRPAREAQIMRRLSERHSGLFPLTVLLRIWREIIAATLSVEGKFNVSVYTPEPIEDGLAYLSLARAYFGAETPLLAAQTESGVLRAVRDGKVSVGVLPIPFDDLGTENQADPWWLTLAGGGDKRPLIVARLPWLHMEIDKNHSLEALAVARVSPEASGDDVSFLAIESSDTISRNRIRSAFAEVGLDVNWAAARYGERASRWQLAEIDGFVTDGDSRLAAFEESLGDEILRLVTLGGYARTQEGERPQPSL